MCSPSPTTWGPSNGIGVNWALSSNGGAAVAGGPYGTYVGTDGVSRYHSNTIRNKTSLNDGDRVNASNYFYELNTYTPHTVMGAYNCAYTAPWFPYAGIAFGGGSGVAHNINEIDIFQLQDSNRTTPTPDMLFWNNGANTYRVEYCPAGTTCTWPNSSYPTGNGWVDLDYAASSGSGSADPGWQRVWNKVTFAPVSATSIMFLFECLQPSAAEPYLVELEAWDTSAVGTNWALSANGATALVSSQYNASYPALGAIDGDRTGWNWGQSCTMGYPANPSCSGCSTGYACNAGWQHKGSGWNSTDYPSDSSPDIFQVQFAGSHAISEVDLFGLQDTNLAPLNPTPPTLGQPFSQYGLAKFQIQYCPNGTNCAQVCSASGGSVCTLDNNCADAAAATCTGPGSGWVDVSGSPVTNNGVVWNQFTFAPISTSQIRAVIQAGAGGGYSRIVELEAWDFSKGTGASGGDALSALALRQEMAKGPAYLGTCTGLGGNSPNTAINGKGGFEQSCGSSWFNVSSPNNGAWLFPALDAFASPSHLATKYLGGSTWPGAASASMAAMGFPTGPYISTDGQPQPDGQNEYQPFEHGVLATAGGRTDSHQIGGIAQCAASTCSTSMASTTCSCNAADHNGALTTSWLTGFAGSSAYPVDDTHEWSLSYTAPPGSLCGPNGLGDRGWVVDTANNTTFTVKDNSSGQAHSMNAAIQAKWESSSCDTLGQLGWPIAEQQSYTVNGASASYQQFEHGLIKVEPSPCSGGSNVATVVFPGPNPVHVQNILAATCGPPTIAQSCTNSAPQTYGGSSTPFGGNGLVPTYYWHCPGIETAPPGATTTGSSVYSGVTITVPPNNCQYTVDDPALSAWLAMGIDQASGAHCTVQNPLSCSPINGDGTMNEACVACSVDAAVYANPPPANHVGTACPTWTYDTRPDGNQFSYSWLESDSSAETDFILQYTTPDSFTSMPTVVLREPAESIPTPTDPMQKNVAIVPGGANNAKNCVQAAFGNPVQTGPVECWYTHADGLSRRPTRLNIQITVDPSTPSFSTNVPVALALQDLTGTPGIQPYGNITWLDTPDNRLQAGAPNNYDLTLGNIGDIDDITNIILASTGDKLCVDGISLNVDDDGQLNNGDANYAGLGAAYRTLYQANYNPPACTSNGTGVVLASFNALRNSPDWTYQHANWLSVVSTFNGGGPAIYSHFSGYPDNNRLAKLFYGMFGSTTHFSRPVNLYSLSSGSCSNSNPCDPSYPCTNDCGYYVPPNISIPNPLGGSQPNNITPHDDVLHVDAWVGPGSGSLDLQLVTHCSATGVANNFVAELLPTNAHLGGPLIGQKIVFLSPIPIVASAGLSPESLSGTKYQMGFRPLNNGDTRDGACGSTGEPPCPDTSVYPGFGVEPTGGGPLGWRVPGDPTLGGGYCDFMDADSYF